MGDEVMNKIPIEPVQALDSQPSQAVLDSLSNSVIVSKVLEFCSTPELLEMSFVNKLWNYEARSVMRKRGDLTARLKSYSIHPWEQVLEAFGADLQKMNTIPYSGISIVINSRGHTAQTGALDLTQDAVLARLALKRLSLFLNEGWWTYKDFPALMLVKKLLQYFGGVLQELTLVIRDKQDEFIEHFVGDCIFAGLKVLKLAEGGYRTTDEQYTNFMKALVSRARSLQELHTFGPVNLKSNVLEGSEALLFYGSRVKAPFENISENFIGRLRLQEMKMFYTGPEFNYERFNRITPMLLQFSCATTLQFMDVDAVLAVMLMSYRISLTNVEELCIDINFNQMEHVEPGILRILKDFDLTRIFPRVNRVTVTSYFNDFEYSLDHLEAIIEQADAALEEPMPDRAAHVKELCLRVGDNSDAALSFFAQMFPNIEQLEISAGYEDEIPFGSIWKHWVDLRGLRVTRGLVRKNLNLDSVFCGIFPEEVAELRLKDEDYLKRVNIVPVMPAIDSLKNLKTLTLNHDGQFGGNYCYDGTFMFSKVTGWIAFARCPLLAIELVLKCYNGNIPEISHLEAFASVTVRSVT